MVEQLKLNIKKAYSFLDCLSQIEKNMRGFIFITDDEDLVIGILSDGDIRRAFLRGAKPTESPERSINKNFSYLSVSHTREQVLKLFDQGKKFVPIIENRKLVGVIFPENLVYLESRDVIARAKSPVRISFGGGGTDLTSFFLDHGGAVLNATINLYAHCVLKKRNDSCISIVSHDFNEKLFYQNIQDMKYDNTLDLIKAAINLLKPSFGFDLEISSDFPPHSGLGGSSAVLAAVISCFNEFREDKLNRYEIAELAFQAERIELSVSGGWQDQYATVFGGFNFIEFNANRNEVFPLKIASEVMNELEARLILCYSGQEHPIGKIHDGQIKKMKEIEVLDYAHKMRDLAYEMKSALLRAQLDKFGKLLHEGWLLKKNFSLEITNTYLDEIYEFAIKNGAAGGKIVGAGGGGFFLFQSEIDKKGSLSIELKKRGLVVKDFIFDDRGVRAWKVRSYS